MEELQDAIEDAQYMNAIHDDVPKPTKVNIPMHIYECMHINVCHKFIDIKTCVYIYTHV
jgi:hypothetical protein